MTRPELRRWTRNIVKKLGWRAFMKDNPSLRVFKRASFKTRLAMLEETRV